MGVRAPLSSVLLCLHNSGAVSTRADAEEGKDIMENKILGKGENIFYRRKIKEIYIYRIKKQTKQ